MVMIIKGIEYLLLNFELLGDIYDCIVLFLLSLVFVFFKEFCKLKIRVLE